MAAAKRYRPGEILLAAGSGSVPIHLVTFENREAVVGSLEPAQRRFLVATGFEPSIGRHAVLSAADGSIGGVVFGLGSKDAPAGPMDAGALPGLLPPGTYHFDTGQPKWSAARLAEFTLAFALGAYRFDRYRAGSQPPPVKLTVPQGVDRARIVGIAESISFGRDLINTPSADMGPAEIADAAAVVAAEFSASMTTITGDELLTKNFPMIHAVGRASPRAPRLVDFSWGQPGAPKITLIGKSIAFDTGGLDIKTADGMLTMKKDMGGGAAVLACARMIMLANLAVRLRVLLPIAENSISGNAFRPGDILTARDGTTVEIGNTDAEGRLVLADSLVLAGEDNPDHVITFATLTGAARVALGPDLPPLYCDDDAFAAALQAKGMEIDDPMWRMPFWTPYEKMLKSPIADMNNVSTGGMAGSITAALFLKRFAKQAKCYTHLDIYGWVLKPKPGRTEGGEPQVARALFETLAEKYGS